ncbi:hypothetical protein ACT691_15490 [Vibrio metschnikovii]
MALVIVLTVFQVWFADLRQRHYGQGAVGKRLAMLAYRGFR